MTILPFWNWSKLGQTVDFWSTNGGMDIFRPYVSSYDRDERFGTVTAKMKGLNIIRNKLNGLRPLLQFSLLLIKKKSLILKWLYQTFFVRPQSWLNQLYFHLNITRVIIHHSNCKDKLTFFFNWRICLPHRNGTH